jgi:PAS domain S-box-containing protein
MRGERAQTALPEQASFAGLRLRDVAEGFPFAFLISDSDGVVLDANQAATRLFGLEHEELTGKSIAYLMPAQYRRTIRTALSGDHDDGAFSWEQEVSQPGGGSKAVEASAFHVEGEQLVAWLFSDISDRVVVDRRLRTLTSELEARVLERTEGLEAERARLAALVRQIPAGLVIVDAAGELVTANDEALRIVGIDSIEGVDMNTVAARSRRTDGSHYRADEWPLARSLQGELVSGERIELDAEDGSRLVVDVSSSPVSDHAGRMIGAVCVLTDVTARERRARVEREFVSNAAHQLQTPLAALVGAVEVLVSGAKDTPERDLFLAHVSREADRLTRLVRGLLVLARAELGTEEPLMSVVPVAPVLESIAEKLTPAAGVAVSTSCREDLAALSNPELLAQAITNVAENAAKYTQQGSIRLEARQRDGGVEISVADTGPGIPEAERPRIFERFHRGSAGSGSGLGLAIVAAVMNVLGGEVELDSTPGEGTVVRLLVPHATAVVST